MTGLDSVRKLEIRSFYFVCYDNRMVLDLEVSIFCN
jgi:hypothetical protein